MNTDQAGYRVLVLDGPGADAAVGLPEPNRVIVPSCGQNHRVAAHRPLVHVHVRLLAVTAQKDKWTAVTPPQSLELVSGRYIW